MTLFHGSEFRIEKPYAGGGKKTNDYGVGFYCTESEDLACEWAVTREAWLASKERRDAAARKDYFDMRKTPYRIEDLSIQKILEERIKPGDSRL